MDKTIEAASETPLEIIKEFLEQDIEDIKKLRKDLKGKYPELCGKKPTEEGVMRNTTVCRVMNPELPYYGQAITWGENYVLADGFPTLWAARIRAIQLAKRDGYTIPRWWQFWRWSDTNVLDWRKQQTAEADDE